MTVLLWINETVKKATQDYKLLDFNMKSKVTNASVVNGAVRKTQQQQVVWHFRSCIMTVLMTIYTGSFLSGTGVITVEVGSAFADITLCAEDDCSMSHTF